MSPKISLIITVAGAALVLGVPAAWGNHQYGDEFYRAEPATVRVSPDLVDRAVAAEQNRLSSMLDARERALGENLGKKVSPLDARERAFGAKLDVQLSSGPYPDVIDRAVQARGTTRAPVGDSDRFRIDHSSVPVPGPATSSGRELEWPQIGIAFGMGILLAFGLWLTVRRTRIRPLAH